MVLVPLMLMLSATRTRYPVAELLPANFRFPFLKYKAPSNLVLENVAMRISGHKTRAVFDRYDIVSGKDLADAAGKMERRLNDSLGTISGTNLPDADDPRKPPEGLEGEKGLQ